MSTSRNARLWPTSHECHILLKTVKTHYRQTEPSRLDNLEMLYISSVLYLSTFQMF